MKITYSLLGLTLGAALLFAVGCGKTEAPSGETQQPAGVSQPVADAAKAVVEQVQTTAVAVADQAVKEVTAKANAAVAAASTQAQQLLDQAKTMVGQEKYQEALNLLQQLKDMKLTPEQQKLLDDLKTQIQTALAKAAGTNAASALGNILGGRK